MDRAHNDAVELNHNNNPQYIFIRSVGVNWYFDENWSHGNSSLHVSTVETVNGVSKLKIRRSGGTDPVSAWNIDVRDRDDNDIKKAYLEVWWTG